MSTLIDGLLTIAQGGKAVDDPEPVDVEDVAREAWRNADVGDAALVVVSSGTVSADPSRLRQLFENLFHNSVEHGSTSSRDGSPVTVTVSVTDDSIVVEDDGQGIPPDARDQVFDHGYSTGDGNGLGLAIVARIAQAHGWSVDVESSDGGGARFVVTGVELAD